MYRSRVASTISAGSGGGGVSDARSQPDSGPVSQLRTNCLSKLGCTFPASYPSAGQYRDESGGEDLVGENQVALRVQSELELGVGEDDAPVRGEVGRPAVDVEGVVAQLHGQVLAHLLDHGLETDVLVVLAQLGLAGGREDRVGKLARLHQPLGQCDAAHRAGLVVVDQPRPREVAAGHALDGDHVELPDHQRAAENLFGDPAVVGFTGQMVVATEDAEEEDAHRGEHPPLVRDRGGAEDVVVGGDPVARDQQKVLVVDRVEVADLATGQMGV